MINFNIGTISFWSLASFEEEEEGDGEVSMSLTMKYSFPSNNPIIYIHQM